MSWLVMIAFAVVFVAVGFALGVWRGRSFSKVAAVIALAIFVAGMSLGLVIYSSNARMSDSAYLVGWAAMLLMFGFAGPALSEGRVRQVAISLIATCVGSPVAVIAVLYIACGCCGQCI